MSKKATLFEFTSCKFSSDKKKIFFNYKTYFLGKAPLFFTETLILPKAPNFKKVSKEALNKALEGLHIILGISYYKLYCATKVKLSYNLTKEEADFWNTVYRKGLGEFFYKNKLNPNNSPKFPYSKKIKLNFKETEKNNNILLAVGGGKDSIVAAELLKEGNLNFTSFSSDIQKKSELVNKIINLIGKDSLRITRILDDKIFDKNIWIYKGHIPISAIYAFLMLLSAVLYKYSYILVANEYSSNFGSLKYKGEDINHQWSKSFEFEMLFQNYARKFVSPNIFYFSLLRPFYEIRIAKLFSKYKKYFHLFSSCNKNFAIGSGQNKAFWCCQCAKCVFVFTLLSAFLAKKDLIKTFGKNLYQDKGLLPLFKDTLGFGKAKPFDCVGTFEEAKVALYLASQKFQPVKSAKGDASPEARQFNWVKNDFIVKALLPRIKKERNLKEITKEVFKTNSAPNTPDHFKFFGMDNALIFGHGKEGKVTEQYLKNNFKKLKIGIADQKFSKNYLEKQKDYDITVKTPGIKKNLLRIPYTTATNMFFSNVLFKNKIIGVTGSKGKSTTASLIYSILKEAGKNVRLMGNIGKPMLKALMQKIKSDEIFVLELSSYQLEDINFSPDIAVVTNLFPEHMNYHGSTKEYYQAKKNIIKFQNKNGVFVYNPKNKELKKWLRGSKGKAIPFLNKIPLENSKIPLLGEHNKENIRAAITVAKIFNIKDEIIKKAVKEFKGLPHRLEFVGEFHGIKFYDDALSTTPESTIMAIKSLPRIKTIFLGGEDRGYDFSELEKTIKKHKIKNTVLFPKSGKRILRQRKGFNILETSSMKKAVKFAFKHTEKGGMCLLSTASPSYSLWKDFEEKGKQFKEAIKLYK